MTVFLTGGAGYIGSHTACLLQLAGYDVVIGDNFTNSSSGVIGRIEAISGKAVKVFDTDLTDIDELERIVSTTHPDAVIHLAGYKAVGQSVSAPLSYYKNNLGITLSLLEVMERHEITKIIFSSSATVYGTPKQLPLTEDMETAAASNPYGSTKQMIERIITDIAAANAEMSALLLRYFNPVGAHESGLIGESPVGIPSNLMPYILQVASGKLPKLNIYGGDYPTPDGTCVRDYIHVTDLALGHVKALEYCLENTGSEIINLGTGYGISVLEMVHAFERVNGVKVPYDITVRRDGDIAECYASPKKAETMLNWRAERTLDDMCRDAWNWQKRL